MAENNITDLIEEMIQKGLRVCVDEGLQAYDAAVKVLDESTYEAVRLLALAGLAKKISSAVKDHRSSGAESRAESEQGDGTARSGRYQHQTKPEEAAAWFWLAKPYGTADGHNLPILDHSLIDVSHNRRMARTQINGWRYREELWEVAATALVENGGERIGDLPSKVLNDLDELAESAFSGRAVVV